MPAGKEAGARTPAKAAQKRLLFKLLMHAGFNMVAAAAAAQCCSWFSSGDATVVSLHQQHVTASASQVLQSTAALCIRQSTLQTIME
jgi:hypothetical protein